MLIGGLKPRKFNYCVNDFSAREGFLEEIDDMNKDTLEWWGKWKDFIFRAMDLTINYNK